MKTLTSLILLLFITLNSYSIPVKTPPLTIASIDTNYRITVPSIPIQRYYYVGMKQLRFDNEEEDDSISLSNIQLPKVGIM